MSVEAVAGTMTKGDFAKALGVSAGRVSQYIAERKIFGDALEGEGRSARIRYDVAVDQLKRSLDPSQRFGLNGKTVMPTVVADAPAAPAPAATQPAPLRTDPTQDELAELRLTQERIKTREAERKESLAVGRYMLTEDVRREMGRLAVNAFKIMDAGLQDLAGAVAEAFTVSQQDAHKVLQKAFREVRAKATERLRDEASRHEALIPVEDGEDEEDRAA